MSSTTPDRPLTAEELLALPNDGHRHELVAGALITMSLASIRSSAIAGDLLHRFARVIEEQELGRYGSAGGGFRLATNPDTVRVPAVWYLRAERIPAEGLPDTFFAGAPDLAVEVLSPSDRFMEIALKVRDYLQADTRLVWVVDPAAGTVGIFRADGSSAFLDRTGTLDGEDVLPGFRLPLGEIFG